MQALRRFKGLKSLRSDKDHNKHFRGPSSFVTNSSFKEKTVTDRKDSSLNDSSSRSPQGQGAGPKSNPQSSVSEARKKSVLMKALMMAAGTGLKTNDPHFQHLQQQAQQQTHPHALFDPVQALQILQNAGYHGTCIPCPSPLSSC